ncbi:MAG: NAD(P)-binding domain-containing protein [Saprospiraceae bacterium]|nr:NAD(P)-binding domain-containing protein [Saprospiraceae bacterium]
MKIALIGAGNVATHLGRKLVEVGQQVVQVFSRNQLKAKKLALELGAGFTDDLNEIDSGADLYIVAVHDDAIGEVAKN